MDDFLLYKRYLKGKKRLEVDDDNVSLQDIYTNAITTQQEEENTAQEQQENVTQAYDETYHYTKEDERFELLIIEVQAHEVLWDRSSKLYHNSSQETRAAWVAISTNLNQEVEILQKNGETCMIAFENAKIEKKE